MCRSRRAGAPLAAGSATMHPEWPGVESGGFPIRGWIASGGAQRTALAGQMSRKAQYVHARYSGLGV
jgi:hypothetical protein